MDPNRRSFLAEAGKFIALTGAASLAWEFVVQGAPEQAPNYDLTEHWWGMLIDIDKCIGCGNCVRACKAENDVLNEPGAFRTWVERYQVHGDDFEHPIVDSPNGGYDGFPAIETPGEASRSSSSRSSAITARTHRACKSVRSARRSRVRTASCSLTRRAASAVATACRPVHTAAATSIRALAPPTSARCVITASRRGSRRRAAKCVPPARGNSSI